MQHKPIRDTRNLVTVFMSTVDVVIHLIRPHCLKGIGETLKKFLHFRVRMSNIELSFQFSP